MAKENIPSIILSYKYRLLPTRQQHVDLVRILEDQRQLYNAGLEARIDRYKKTGEGVSYFTQCKELSELRQDSDYFGTPVNLQRWTLKRLDNSYKGFFSRIRRGVKAGFPRFRGKGQWKSFGFAEFSGIILKNNRLRFKGLTGGLRIRFHRALPDSKILSCVFRRDVKGWSVLFQVRIPIKNLGSDRPEIGIDLGLKDLAVLSNGEHIPNPHAAKKHERELRRRQRALARCKRGSNRRKKVRQRLTKTHEKISNIRDTYLHQVSARLAKTYSKIAFENLNIKGMVKNHHLARAINDASWNKLIQYTTYKAEKAGGIVKLVDPKGTTQICSSCGSVVPKKLKDRWHSCPYCGFSIDRDENAAKNILQRAVLASLGSQRKAVVYA